MAADVSIFAGLNDRIQTDIADEIEWCHIRGGDVLFRQGDDGDSLYIVVSGRLRVVQEHAVLGPFGLELDLAHADVERVLIARLDVAQATRAEDLKVPAGFKVELLRSAKAGEGSWICMTTDPQGRLIISPQQDDLPLFRIM